MDGTGGFSASNRSRDNSPRRSDCRGSWLYSGENKSWRNFSLSPDFACTSTTGSPMDKWMAQADSAHRIGPETSLQSILIVVESGGTGEELPRLCNSTLYLKSIPRLCNSTLQLNSLQLNSIPRLCTSALQLDSLQLDSLQLDSLQLDPTSH